MPRPKKAPNAAQSSITRAAAAMKYKGIAPTPPGSDDPANNGPISPANNMVQDIPSPGLIG